MQIWLIAYGWSKTGAGLLPCQVFYFDYIWKCLFSRSPLPLGPDPSLLFSPPVHFPSDKFPNAPGPIATWSNKAKIVRSMARGAIRSVMEGGGKYGDGTCKAWDVMISTQNLCCASSKALVRGNDYFALGSIIPWSKFRMPNNDFSRSPPSENWHQKVGWKEFQLLAVELLANRVNEFHII